MPIRIYDIAKKLGLESKEVLARAKELGITAAKVPSSSLDVYTGEYLAAQLGKVLKIESAPQPVVPEPSAAVTPEPPFAPPHTVNSPPEGSADPIHSPHFPTKLEKLKQRAGAGSEVILIIAGGSEIRGRIVRFEKSLVVINQDGRERSFFEESINGFELVSSAGVEASQDVKPSNVVHDLAEQPKYGVIPPISPQFDTPSGPTLGDKVGFIRLPMRRPRPAEKLAGDDEIEVTNLAPPKEDEATLTGMTALEHLDGVRKALRSLPGSLEEARQTAHMLAVKYSTAPFAIQRDSKIRSALIGVFKAIEYERKLALAQNPSSSEALGLSRTLLEVNAALRLMAGLPDHERFKDLYHFLVAVRPHREHFDKDAQIWKALGDSLREAYKLGMEFPNQPATAALWQRETHLKQTHLGRMAEICRNLILLGFSAPEDRTLLKKQAEGFALVAGCQRSPEPADFAQAREEDSASAAYATDNPVTRLATTDERTTSADRMSLPSAPVRDVTARTLGRITWFDSKRGFGFIETRSGKEVWFHISEVNDEYLRQSLDGPPGATGTDVSFEERAAFGQKYNRAANVCPPVPEEHRPTETQHETFPRRDPAAGKPDQHPRALPLPLPSGSRFPEKSATGRITSFGNQGFGFIETPDGRTLFFRLEDVLDDILRQQLLTPNQMLGMEINFEQQASPGHKYDRAIAVSLLLSEADMLIQASQLERSKDYTTALGLVRRVLAKIPDNGQALELQQRLLKSIARVTVLPKGGGPFADAKRAWIVDQDLERAESLYRLAITQNDRLEAAVKDLASLLQQREKPDAAISLLEQYRKRGTVAGAFDQMLATIYEHTGQFSKAIDILLRMEQFAAPSQRLVLLRRIARAYFKSRRYEEAERTLQDALRLRPDDPLASRWLTSLQLARQAGSYQQADELLAELGDVVNFGSGLSPLAEAMLDQCQFDGVEPTKIASGQFSLDDVARLEELADKLGTQRPRDRAAYYLSAAAILRKVQPGEESPRFGDFLQRYFISMGDAARAEQKHVDVVRTYYAESLALSREHTLADRRQGTHRSESPSGYALRTLFRSYVSPQVELYSDAGRAPILAVAIDAISRDALRNPGSDVSFFNGLLNLTIRSRTALLLLQRAIVREDVRTAMARYLECPQNSATTAIKGALEKRRMTLADDIRRLDTSCATMTQLRLTTASMEDLRVGLDQLNRELLGDLDCLRLNALRQVAANSLAFCQAADFEERERHYFSVRMGSDRLRKEIEESPTHVSFQSFLRVVNHLNSLVEESYAELARTSLPDLNLTLEIEVYIPDTYGDVDLHIGVTNGAGCSPASSLELIIGTYDSAYFAVRPIPPPATGALRGGARTVVLVPLRVQARACEEGAFPIALAPRFQNRLGQWLAGSKAQFTVRLYDESKFTLIEPNPYAPYSEGGPVENSEMVFGRKELLSHVCEALLATGGTKSVVIYGQKRAGKSTVLEHLKHRLLCANCLPVAFSLQAISTTLTEASFLYSILLSILEAVRMEPFRSQWNISFDLPVRSAFESHPALLFQERMAQLLHCVRARADTSPPRIVLLIDEFTDIFTQIQQGKIQPEFMKLWKAIIEKRYFSCVLVGKDIMPAFMAQFPNELGVIEAQRLTYLSESATRQLITEPVQRDCYRGNAVARILELTACSPYYAMMFCDRLVDYMNETRSLYVTEADVERVKAKMISGPDNLTKWRFDPLYKPGEGTVDTGIDPEKTFAVCVALARGSVNSWCLRSALADVSANVHRILEDLENREVVELKQDSYRIRVGLFREWLLTNGSTA